MRRAAWWREGRWGGLSGGPLPIAVLGHGWASGLYGWALRPTNQPSAAAWLRAGRAGAVVSSSASEIHPAAADKLFKSRLCDSPGPRDVARVSNAQPGVALL